MTDSRETQTKSACVIGWPVAQARSPVVHGYWLEKYGIAGTYDRREVAPEDMAPFMDQIRSGRSGLSGCNVTIPHKIAAFELADRPDELATALGAANTLWVEGGLIHASNTDGIGFTGNLDQVRPGWDKTKKAVVLGAGGGARSIILALKRRGIGAVHIVNRTFARANELANRFGDGVFAHTMDELPSVMKGTGLFVNTTSLGMKGGAVPALDFSPMAKDALVADIVYVPLVTPIMAQAAEQGFATADGLGMLLHQAVFGFEKWFGMTPEVDDGLRAAVLEDLEQNC